MKAILTLAWFLACSVLAVSGGLLELKSMVEELTGKNALMSYGFYGCYCGWGGQGTPKDVTDWCCWTHDRNYGRLEKKGCDIRLQSYPYRVFRGRVTCERGSLCQRKLCSSDRKLAYCLKRNLKHYNTSYQFYSSIFCT